MKGKHALFTVVAACALCVALAGCSGGSASSSAASSSTSSETASSAANSSSTAEATSVAASAASASSASSIGDNHNSYFVGKWDLYATQDAPHEQVVQVMEKYATDEVTRAQMNEAYGRDNVEFCARFNADGTGEMDTGAKLVAFTWEATNESAVTFTSFDGKETAMHVPVSDDKFTLNGDTYAKAN